MTDVPLNEIDQLRAMLRDDGFGTDAITDDQIDEMAKRAALPPELYHTIMAAEVAQTVFVPWMMAMALDEDQAMFWAPTMTNTAALCKEFKLTLVGDEVSGAHKMLRFVVSMLGPAWDDDKTSPLQTKPMSDRLTALLGSLFADFALDMIPEQ